MHAADAADAGAAAAAVAEAARAEEANRTLEIAANSSQFPCIAIISVDLYQK